MGRHVTRSVLRVRLARSAAVTAVALVGAVAASAGGIAPIRVGGPGSTFLGWALVAPGGIPTALGQGLAVAVPEDQPVALGPSPRRPTSDRPVTTSGGSGSGDGGSTQTTGTGGDSGSTGGGSDSGSTGQPVDTGTPPETILPEPSNAYPVKVTLTRHPWKRPLAPASTESATLTPSHAKATDDSATYAVWVTHSPSKSTAAAGPSKHTGSATHHRSATRRHDTATSGSASSHRATASSRKAETRQQDRSHQRSPKRSGAHQPRHAKSC